MSCLESVREDFTDDGMERCVCVGGLDKERDEGRRQGEGGGRRGGEGRWRDEEEG